MDILLKIFSETLRILSTLIKFQTISGASNLELIKYCEKKLEDAGAKSFKTFNESKSQANLFSTISGKNNSNEKGIILSGVSAGAVCWFEWILTDSLGNGYQPLKGIGLLEGSCTPHSSDLNRINEFENNIKNSKLPSGFAIDDGVAVLFIDGKPSDVYSARKNHNAYFVNKENKISLNEYIKNIE